jgi:3-oxoacid CoA-transferase subunit A
MIGRRGGGSGQVADGKVCGGVAEALEGLLRDGMTIMSGGFGLCGNAEACIDAIAASRIRNLTIVSNNCGNQGQGLAVLLKNGQVARVICSFVGGNPDLAEQLLAGRVQVELVPQGTFAERIRAGGAGIAGFYTPTGVGTMVAEGKELREIDGRTYLFERPLRADLAIVRAAVADRFGNLRFYKTARNFNPLMATAADVTVVETDRLVPTGSIDPDDVHLPGLFVKRIVEVREHRNVIEHRTTRAPGSGSPADATRTKIGRQ